MHPITGSCLCGALTYTCSSEALLTAVCHCKACQKSTGSAFSVVVGVNKSDVTIAGDTLATYEDIGDSGQATYRRFCSKCGSTILAELAARPDLACIKAGTLDRPGRPAETRDDFQEVILQQAKAAITATRGVRCECHEDRL